MRSPTRRKISTVSSSPIGMPAEAMPRAIVIGTSKRLVELVGPDLGVEVVADLVQREQSFDLLGPPGDFVEVAELVRPAALLARRPGPPRSPPRNRWPRRASAPGPAGRLR